MRFWEILRAFQIGKEHRGRMMEMKIILGLIKWSVFVFFAFWGLLLRHKW